MSCATDSSRQGRAASASTRRRRSARSSEISETRERNRQLALFHSRSGFARLTGAPQGRSASDDVRARSGSPRSTASPEGREIAYRGARSPRDSGVLPASRTWRAPRRWRRAFAERSGLAMLASTFGEGSAAGLRGGARAMAGGEHGAVDRRRGTVTSSVCRWAGDRSAVAAPRGADQCAGRDPAANDLTEWAFGRAEGPPQSVAAANRPTHMGRSRTSPPERAGVQPAVRCSTIDCDRCPVRLVTAHRDEVPLDIASAPCASSVQRLSSYRSSKERASRSSARDRAILRPSRLCWSQLMISKCRSLPRRARNDMAEVVTPSAL